MSFVFYSKPARIITYIAIPVIFLSQFVHPTPLGFLTQILMYGLIAYNAECLSEGGCEMWSWVSIGLPVLYSILYIFFGAHLGLVASPPNPLSNLMPVSNIETSKTQIATMLNNNTKENMTNYYDPLSNDIGQPNIEQNVFASYI